MIVWSYLVSERWPGGKGWAAKTRTQTGTVNPDLGRGDVTYAVFFLLDLNNRPVFECPLDNIGLVADSLDEFGCLESRPEVGEVLQLDMMPDVGERSSDDGALNDSRRGRDGGR